MVDLPAVVVDSSSGFVGAQIVAVVVLVLLGVMEYWVAVASVVACSGDDGGLGDGV